MYRTSHKALTISVLHWNALLSLWEGFSAQINTVWLVPRPDQFMLPAHRSVLGRAQWVGCVLSLCFVLFHLFLKENLVSYSLYFHLDVNNSVVSNLFALVLIKTMLYSSPVAGWSLCLPRKQLLSCLASLY